MPEETAGIWQAVRRALGRLAGTARVRELSPAALAAAPTVVVLPSLAVPAPDVGVPPWKPSARALVLPPPQASAGAGEAALTPAATVAHLNAALTPDAGLVHAAELPPLACTIHRLDSPALAGQAVTVPSLPMALLAGVVSRSAVRFIPPDTARLPLEAPALVSAPTRAGGRAAPVDLLRLMGGNVRLGTGMLAQIPLKRVGRPVPKGLPAAAFAAEWQLLAQKAGVPPEDVLLVGVFPQVPVAAVRRLALDENGALCLWLKPEALAAAAAGRTPRLATLIVGRRRSTGKMIQTVA